MRHTFVLIKYERNRLVFSVGLGTLNHLENVSNTRFSFVIAEGLISLDLLQRSWLLWLC